AESATPPFVRRFGSGCQTNDEESTNVERAMAI
ncbi:MAG: hypothetical protein AVDCRST_MAG74-1207, partial [uncultured Pyrinomonadaceae bacterium]